MNGHILQRIRKFCKEYSLLEKGDRVVVGFSGGADSVFLVRVLQELMQEWELTLALVHVNHGIRGEEADGDEQFCRTFAADCGLPFTAYHGNVRQLAQEQSVSLEDAGRSYRYECLERYCTENGFQKIAVAHHENDQAETVLFRMLRGSSLRGLGGMRPVRGRVIRPLLPVSREEIVGSLREMGQGWQEDSTNADTAYSRNLIRRELLPRMQENISSASVRHLADQAEQMQELYDYVAAQSEKYYSVLVREYSGKRRREISCKEFLGLPIVLRRELAFRMLEECAGSRRDLTKRHLDSLCRLAESDTGRRIALPYGMTAGQDYGLLWVELMEQKETTHTEGDIVMPDRTCAGVIADLSASDHISLDRILQDHIQEVLLGNPRGEAERICLKIMPITDILQENNGKLPKNSCTKCFDYDKINIMPVFRHPQEGDYFLMDESGQRKKVSRYLIDRHVVRERRRELWVLASGHHVIWIPELGRVSAGVYVTEDTKTILYAMRKAEEEIQMKETIRVLYSDVAVKKRVEELAEQINRDYKGKTLHLICILKGSVFFCCELTKQLMVPITLDFMTVSSYGNDTESSGKLDIKKDIDESIEGKECLVVEDIVDTGNTLSLLKENLLQREPASLKFCTLLDKPERRETAMEADYVGFVIPDEFVVGYGMDYAQKYRNLPYIGVLELSEE